jgi:hypothetical protein
VAATIKKYPYPLIMIGVFTVVTTTGTGSQAEAAQLKLVPSISVSEKYDDNVFVAEEDLEADYITAIAPELTASYEAKTVRMSAGLNARSELFAQHTELNNLQYGANLRLNAAQLTKNTSLTVSDLFRFTPEPPDFLVGEDEEAITTGGIRIPRGDSLSNLVRIGMTQKISQKNDGKIEYANRVRVFEDPSLVDSTSHSAQTGLDRQIGPRDVLNTGYQYQLFLPKEGEKSQSHNASVGLDHRFTQTFTVNIRIGSTYVIRDPDNAFVFSGRLGVRTRFKFTHLNLSYSRTVDTSGLSAEPITSQVVSATMERDLTRHLAIHLTQNYATNRSALTDKVDLQSWRTRIGLTMEFTRWLRGEAEYHYFFQESNGSVGRDIRRNQAFVILSASLPD